MPFKPELKMKDAALYKAYYCGLCEALQRNYGLSAKLTLNYDCTFAAVFISGISSEVNGDPCRLGSCPYKPFKKKYPIAKPCFALDFAAALNVLLAYYKFDDDINDSRSVTARVGKRALRVAAKKAMREYSEMDSVIKKGLSSLADIERKGEKDIDGASIAFGKLLSDVFICFSHVSEDPACIISEIGYNIGKWIYLIDAFCDMEKDNKKGNYNPFPIDCSLEQIEAILTLTLNDLNSAYELLTVTQNRSLIENIICDGFINKTTECLKSKQREKKNVGKSI